MARARGDTEPGVVPRPCFPDRFEAPNPDYEQVLKDSFERQAIMHLLGAQLGVVRAGFVELQLPYREELTQQHGIIHGGVMGLLIDNACAGAALTLFPADSAVLAADYSVNFHAPARECDLTARAWVVRPGRSLTTCWGQVTFRTGGEDRLTATGQATLSRVAGRSDIPAG